MSINFEINKEFNGIEIKFSEKPTQAVLKKLKELGFRWHPQKCVWYAKNTDERLAFAQKIQNNDEYEQMTLFSTAEEKPQTDEPKAEPKVVKAETKKAVKEPKKDVKKATTTKAKAETKKETPKTETKKDNIIEFAKARPDIKVRMAINENATLEQCQEKINKEKAVYIDSDSTFVLDGLLEMCKVNPNFRNNFMRENKTYSGAFAYFMNLARQGYAHNYDGVAFLDNNLALGMAMDYFNMIDEQ